MIIKFDDKKPNINPLAFVAQTACVIGDVKIGARSSVWFGAVLRGDFNEIVIGERTNVQDLCVLHTPGNFPLIIGDDVTIGHRAIVHGCKVGSRVLVGMGAVIMNGAIIEDDVIIGAGALVTEGTKVPSKTLMLGIPAKPKRELTSEELKWLIHSAAHYADNAQRYRQM